MEDVTGDSQKMFRIRLFVQNTPLLSDPNARLEVVRAKEPIQNYEGGNPEMYLVDMMVQGFGIPLKGYVDLTNNILFLDARSMLTIMNDVVVANLEAFNAGHHWRFKGV